MPGQFPRGVGEIYRSLVSAPLTKRTKQTSLIQIWSKNVTCLTRLKWLSLYATCGSNRNHHNPTVRAAFNMATTSRPASVIRRSSQVYVSVPPTSYRTPTSYRKDSLTSLESEDESPISSLSSLKENTPLRPTRTNSELTSMTTLSTLTSKSNKRKHAEETDLPLSEEQREAKGPKAKKPRVLPNVVPPKPTRVSKKPRTNAKVKVTKEPKELKEDADEFPNGFFYCHQCTKKRDLSCECARFICVVRSLIGL